MGRLIRTMHSSIKMRIKSFRLMTIGLVIVFMLSVYYLGSLVRFGRGSGGTSGSSNNIIYSIVIDAGSTGSRIHIFRLNHMRWTHQPNKFDVKLMNEELFVKVKPGLSSFAKEPEKATESIRSLLDQAVDIIPKDQHQVTRLTLKATAGLRMLSDQIANKILDNIRKLFREYPFSVISDEDVSIMDGKYEGIYSWLTLNYALNTFDSSQESQVCSLDLGGGSTQVNFMPSDGSSLADKEDIVDFKLDQIRYNILAKSFLGFGLMSARQNILQKTAKENELTSVCIPHGHSLKWVQQGTEYGVRGSELRSDHTYEKCYASVLSTIKAKFVAPFKSELSNKKIYAFSYFYDRLNSSRLFQCPDGGSIKLQTLLDRTIEVCNSSPVFDESDKENSFMCMDLAYIYSLLKDGYGLPNDKEINVYRELGNMEISWALGAAFHMIND